MLSLAPYLVALHQKWPFGMSEDVQQYDIFFSFYLIEVQKRDYESWYNAITSCVFCMQSWYNFFDEFSC